MFVFACSFRLVHPSVLDVVHRYHNYDTVPIQCTVRVPRYRSLDFLPCSSFMKVSSEKLYDVIERFSPCCTLFRVKRKNSISTSHFLGCLFLKLLGVNFPFLVSKIQFGMTFHMEFMNGRRDCETQLSNIISP